MQAIGEFVNNPGADGRQSGRRVLVVDDNLLLARALVRTLELDGFEAIPFQNGNDAMRYIGENKFDLALVDIHLPDMDGLTLAKFIRTHHGDQLPIIVVSGDTSIDTLRSLATVGATYFLSKPLNKTHLLSRLHEWKDWRLGQVSSAKREMD